MLEPPTNPARFKPALALIKQREVVDARECVGMGLAEDLPTQRQRLGMERLGLVEAALALTKQREVVEARESVGMGLAEPPMAAIATFALNAGLWFRRGRLVMVAPRFSAIFLPLSSGISTQSPRPDFPSHLWGAIAATRRHRVRRATDVLEL
jgi:hypothetical protein